MTSKAWFIIAGVVLLIGLISLVFEKLGISPFDWFGKLPGDIHSKSDRHSFSFPVVSCLILSVGGSVVLNLLMKFFR